MSKEVKNVAESYKIKICNEILQVTINNKPEDSQLIGYTYALRHFLTQNEEEQAFQLLQHLNVYVDFAITNCQTCDTAGYLILFITILQNKSKIPGFEEESIIKFWNSCKENVTVYSRFEEYSQLVTLIVGHVSNEVFPDVMRGFLDTTENSITKHDLALFGKHLKTWEAMLSCSLNPIKTKILQTSLETVLQKIILLFDSCDIDEKLLEHVFDFEKTLVRVNQLHLTPAVMDLLLTNINILICKKSMDFNVVYSVSISMLINLLKHRKPLVMDRLPPFLQQYRILLRSLCKQSNSDLNLNEHEIWQVSDCAHQLEKLTRSLVAFPKDMGRIAMYLIADVLEQYEQVTLYPNVKMHLNNCIYSLISICDQHAVNYLLRVLSTASTELFKILYDNYKKYYRFTGKV